MLLDVKMDYCAVCEFLLVSLTQQKVSMLLLSTSTDGVLFLVETKERGRVGFWVFPAECEDLGVS